MVSFGQNHSFRLSENSIPASSSSGGATPRALVVLVGWFGANTRHLSKYETLYRDMGCITLTVVADPAALMFRMTNQLKGCALQVVGKVAEVLKSQPSIPVITHAFSNGGAFITEHMEVLIDEARAKTVEAGTATVDETSKNLIRTGDAWLGQIFDSAPAYISWDIGFKVSSLAFPNPFVRFFAALFMSTIRISEALKGVIGLTDGTKEYWSHMLDSKHGTQLFIYSVDDSVTDATKLEDFVAQRSWRRHSVVRA